TTAFRPVGSVVHRARGCIDDRDGLTPRGASTMQLLTVSADFVPGIQVAILSSCPHAVPVSMPSAQNSFGVTETPDPNKCGCRNLRCCEETGHKPGACVGTVATKFWTFWWEYYCAPCREYGWCGSKTRESMTVG